MHISLLKVLDVFFKTCEQCINALVGAMTHRWGMGAAGKQWRWHGWAIGGRGRLEQGGMWYVLVMHEVRGGGLRAGV